MFYLQQEFNGAAVVSHFIYFALKKELEGKFQSWNINLIT
jgi:hypothetical protein